MAAGFGNVVGEQCFPQTRGVGDAEEVSLRPSRWAPRSSKVLLMTGLHDSENKPEWPFRGGESPGVTGR